MVNDSLCDINESEMKSSDFLFPSGNNTFSQQAYDTANGYGSGQYNTSPYPPQNVNNQYAPPQQNNNYSNQNMAAPQRGNKRSFHNDGDNSYYKKRRMNGDMRSGGTGRGGDSNIRRVTIENKLDSFLKKNKQPRIFDFIPVLSRSSKIYFSFKKIIKSTKSFAQKVQALLYAATKCSHPFFKKANLNFINSFREPENNFTCSRSEHWNQPLGILQSLTAPSWRFYMQINSGFEFYSPHATNIFDIDKVQRSFLVNPPFALRGDSVDMTERFQPLIEHIKHWINLAYASKKPQVLILPDLNKKDFTAYLESRGDLGILHFNHPLLFTKGSNFELHSISPERVSLLFIGLHFETCRVHNNVFGNFVMKKKFVPLVFNIFNKHFFENSEILPKFLHESVAWTKRVHDVLHKSSPTYLFPDEFPDRKPFSLGKKSRSITNYDLYLTRTVSEYNLSRYFPIENVRKKSSIFMKVKDFIALNEKNKIFQKSKESKFCFHCRKETHSTAECYLNQLGTQHLMCEDDIKIRNFVKSKKHFQASYLEQHQQVPSRDLLNLTLQNIDKQAQLFKEEIQPLGIKFVTDENYSQFENHIHYQLALNAPVVDILNLSLGFNQLLAFKDCSPPRIHLKYPKPNSVDNQKIWEQIFKDLKENKIFYIEKKDLLFSIPVFSIHQTNAFGVEKDRLINNFRPFKHLIAGVPFKLKNIQYLKKVSRGAFVLVLDVASCYPSLKELLPNVYGFSGYNEIDQEWVYFASKSPLFGLQTAPYLAFLAFKFLLDFFALFCFFASIYIDDIYLIIATEDENISEIEFFDRMRFVVGIFTRVGIKLSDKMKIESTTFPLYTGLYYSTLLDRLFPNPIKIHELSQIIEKALDDGWVSIKTLKSIEGKTAWITKTRRFMFARFISNLVGKIIRKHQKLKPSRKDFREYYQEKLHINNEILSVFFLFFQEINNCYITTKKKKNYTFATLTTDASPDNAGFFLILPDQSFQCGAMQLTETCHLTKFSSTFAEAEAVYISLLNNIGKLKEYKINEVLILTDSHPLYSNYRNEGSKHQSTHEILLRISNFLNHNQINYEFSWHPRSKLYARAADFFTKNYEVLHSGLADFLAMNFDIRGSIKIFAKNSEIAMFTKRFFYRNTFDFTSANVLVFLLPVQNGFLEFCQLVNLLSSIKMSFLIITIAERGDLKKHYLSLNFHQKFNIVKFNFPRHILAYPQAYKGWKQLVFMHFA